MTSTEEHIRRIKEHIEELEEAIDKGIEKRPSTIGFHCSSCAVELLELYLHISNRITSGKVIKHDWFKRPVEGQKVSPLADRMVDVEFPDKGEIFHLLYVIEDRRNSLLYGKPDIKDIKEVVNSFNRLKGILTKKIEDEGVHIG